MMLVIDFFPCLLLVYSVLTSPGRKELFWRQALSRSFSLMASSAATWYLEHSRCSIIIHWLIEWPVCLKNIPSCKYHEVKHKLICLFQYWQCSCKSVLLGHLFHWDEFSPCLVLSFSGKQSPSSPRWAQAYCDPGRHDSKVRVAVPPGGWLTTRPLDQTTEIDMAPSMPAA